MCVAKITEGSKIKTGSPNHLGVIVSIDDPADCFINCTDDHFVVISRKGNIFADFDLLSATF